MTKSIDLLLSVIAQHYYVSLLILAVQLTSQLAVVLMDSLVLVSCVCVGVEW